MMDFDNEQEPSQDKLDIEYRQILRIIKPYIQTINNNTYLAQYRIWLEKLSETDEKFLRNQYLMELARQIQCKHLENPFTQNPPRGPLTPLRVLQENFEETPYDVPDPYMTKQKMCQQWTEDNDCTRQQWPYHHSSATRQHQQRIRQNQITPELREAQKCIQRSASSVKKLNLLKEIDEQNDNLHILTKTSPTRPLPPLSPRESDLKKRHHSIISQNSSLGVIHESNVDINEEVSWGEMSDDISNVSLAVLGSGDTEGKKKEQKRINQQEEHFEKKINTLMIEINGLKRKSERVNERCEHTLRNVQEQIPAKQKEQNEDTKDVNETQTFNEKDENFLTTDWKKVVESLQVRLSETQNQNRELNALISTLHKKIKEMDATKEQIKQEIKKQYYEQYKNEIESLKTNHTKLLNEIEKEQEKKIKENEENFNKLKNEFEEKYENKIQNVEKKYKKDIDEKNNEINRLEDIVQKECLRLVNEISLLRTQIEDASHTNTSNDERILFLQKCITKMDRLFQKSEREYSKQIEKLKQELDNRDKAIQIQLQTQKAEIIARCSTEKQTEIDIVVQNLETKYTKLLEMQQEQLTKTKNESEFVINKLKLLLERHDIPY